MAESEFDKRYRKPYQYRSKCIREGTDKRIKELKNQGLTFEKIGKICHMSRQQASQIYYKTISKEIK